MPDALSQISCDEAVPQRLLYRPAEVCRLLSLGRTKVYELLGTGELQSVQLGSARLVPAEALDAFVRQLSATPAAPQER